MDAKWPTSGPPPDEGLDFRLNSDGSWWPVRLRLDRKGVLRVMYRDFSPADDELFEAKQFQSLEDVEAFKARFRQTSVQLQDGDCERVIEGMDACVSHAFKEDDVRFFDAVVEEVNFSEHKCIEGEDVCTCTFIVLWLGGPLVGQKTLKGIEDICLLQPVGGKIDPMLDQFIDMARKRFQTKKQLGPEVTFQNPSSNVFELPKSDHDSSNRRMNTFQARSTIDDLENTRFSPCKPKIPKTCPVLRNCHAFIASENDVGCSFCARTYSCSLKVMYHLAGVGGRIEECPSVPIYWRTFYSKYIRASDSAPCKKPRESIVAEIRKELAAEIEAGCIPLPSDQDTVTVVPSHKRSQGLAEPTNWRDFHVLEHSIDKEVEVPKMEEVVVPKKMKGSTNEQTVQRSWTKPGIDVPKTERGCWERKVRMRLQRCFQYYDMPNRIVQNQNFEAACRLIAAAAKDGHDDILPTAEEMGVWILSDSDDDES